MNVGGRQEYVNARTRCILQCLPGALNVGTAGASQASNDRTTHHRRDRPHRLEVTVRGDGETGLNHVHSQTVELVSQAQLFLLVHAATRRLLAIAKRGVENRDASALCGHDLPQK